MAGASGPSLYNFSSYWMSDTMSDLLLRIELDSGDEPPPAKRARGAKQQQAAACAGKELPGHGIVLAACSPYFEAELTRWREQKGRGRSKQHIITLHVDSQEELEAAHTVLQYMYQRCLPDSVSQQQLMAILQLADKYGVEACAAACAESLGTQELEWDTGMHVLQLPPAYNESPLFSNLFSKVSDQLQQQLGDLEVAWASDEGRERFLALPFKGVELLLSDDRTRVAYENTVLVAATVWVQQHDNSLTAAAKKRLAELIRLPHLTPLFASGMVLSLPWLVQALGTPALVAALGVGHANSSNGNRETPLLTSSSLPWPVSWTLKRRPASVCKLALVEWSMPLDKLEAAFEGEVLYSGLVFFGGLEWRMRLVRAGACKPGPQGDATTAAPTTATLAVYASPLIPSSLKLSAKHKVPVAIAKGSVTCIGGAQGAAIREKTFRNTHMFATGKSLAIGLVRFLGDGQQSLAAGQVCRVCQCGRAGGIADGHRGVHVTAHAFPCPHVHN